MIARRDGRAINRKAERYAKRALRSRSALLDERYALGLKSAAGGCSSRPKAAPQVAK